MFNTIRDTTLEIILGADLRSRI